MGDYDCDPRNQERKYNPKCESYNPELAFGRATRASEKESKEYEDAMANREYDEASSSKARQSATAAIEAYNNNITNVTNAIEACGMVDSDSTAFQDTLQSDVIAGSVQSSDLIEVDNAVDAKSKELAGNDTYTRMVSNSICPDAKALIDDQVALLAAAGTNIGTLKAALDEQNAINKAQAEAIAAQVEAAKHDPDLSEDEKALKIASLQAQLDQLKKQQAEGGATIEDIAATVPPFFSEQCFLLAQIQEFIKYKVTILDRKLNGKRLPYATTGETDAWNNTRFNACLLAQGDPFAFINHLTQYPGYEHLLTMKTSEIANLQPMIRLFKIITERDSAGNPKKEVKQFEIPFDSHFTKADLDFFKDKDKRGVGVGIKDFTFSYEGDNPFAVKKAIKAKLTLFANSFDELLVPRGDSSHEFKYVDLALKTGRSRSFSLASLDPKQAEIVQENLSKLDFRLKAVIGWAHRSGWPEFSTLSSDAKDAIYNSCVTLNLTPTVHTFDIDDQGRVKFVINYLAYVEDFFDQPNFNIFTDFDVEKRRIERKIKEQTWVAKCKSEEFSELKKAEKPEIEKDKIKSFQSLIGNLFSREKIRYINLQSADVLDFRQQGPFFNTGGISSMGTLSESEGINLSKELQAAIGNPDTDPQARVRMLSVAGTGAENKDQTLSFFFVSDLVDIIMQGIDEKFGDGDNSLGKHLETLAQNPGATLKTPDGGAPITGTEVKEQISQQAAVANTMGEQFKRFRLLLGPLEIVNQADLSKSIFPSLGDLPISVKYFTEWLSRKMSKRDEVYYPLPKFLNDFFNGLVREFLNSGACFDNQAKQKTRVSQAVVTSYKTSSNHADEITELIWSARGGSKAKEPYISRIDLHDHKNTRPLLANISGERDSPIVEKDVDLEINYLTFFAGRTQPAEKMTGNESDDHSRGIFHYSIGRDRGITKTIKLKKTDSTGLKELRFEQDGYDGLKQLREVFDVDIDTYANVAAYPGNYIYVDPTGFSPKTSFGAGAIDLTQIGIGGYHMIIRSEHSFGPGRADSRIFAKWVASTDARASTNPQGEDMTTAGSTNAVYCWSESENSNRETEAQGGSLIYDAEAPTGK